MRTTIVLKDGNRVEWPGCAPAVDPSNLDISLVNDEEDVISPVPYPFEEVDEVIFRPEQSF